MNGCPILRVELLVGPSVRFIVPHLTHCTHTLAFLCAPFVSPAPKAVEELSSACASRGLPPRSSNPQLWEMLELWDWPHMRTSTRRRKSRRRRARSRSTRRKQRVRRQSLPAPETAAPLSPAVSADEAAAYAAGEFVERKGDEDPFPDEYVVVAFSCETGSTEVFLCFLVVSLSYVLFVLRWVVWRCSVAGWSLCTRSQLRTLKASRVRCPPHPRPSWRRTGCTHSPRHAIVL